MPRKRVKTSKRWVEAGPLAPWMTLYAQWLAGEPGAELTGNRSDYRTRYPTALERSAKASFCAERAVQVELVRILEKRQDFRDYFDRLRADTSFHAKALAQEQIGRNFQVRAEGLEMALTEKDHKSIEHYTRPFLEHGIPKKDLGESKPQQVIINMFGMPAEQKKRLLAGITEPEELDEITYEVIENPKLLNDGEDD